MNRRDFLKSSVSTCGALALSTRAGMARPDKQANQGSIHIQYIREKVPPFKVPPYSGQSYKDKVPDTLDIAERAKLGIHALTSITDPTADCEIYWKASFFRDPPVLAHDFNDWVQLGEGLQEALPLLRVATGDTQSNHVDTAWMNVLLKSIGPDGLVYAPMKGRPWSEIEVPDWELDPVWRADGSTIRASDKSVSQITTGELCARTFPAMTVYYLRDQNPLWTNASEKMIQRLTELAIDKGDYAYVSGAWEPNAKVSRDAEMPLGIVAEEMNGRLIQGLSQYYKVTGYAPARELAAKLMKFFRYHSQYYDQQGRFSLAESEKHWLTKYDIKNLTLGGHGHGHALGILCMWEYGTAVNDPEVLQFVRTSYEWVRNQNALFGVSSTVGWFPEFFAPNYPSCETCTVADMVSLAVKLSVSGAGDYWDDADRWLRNQFAEVQLTDVDWVYKLSSRSTHKPVGANESADHAPERNVGAWAGGAGPNDWALGVASSGIGHCCTGNSARALYYTLEHMVHYHQGELRVNLLMNLATRWADVYSYIPYQGRVDLKMKEDCDTIFVRAPEWVEMQSPKLACKVNKSDRPLHWEGRYVNLGAAKAGDRISITFSIAERTVKEKIGPETYTLLIKGNTVLSIDPPGKNGPLYQNRMKYRKEEVQWQRVSRFVPEEPIEW